MKKKFSLIKCYPGSPELGTIVVLNDMNLYESFGWYVDFKKSSIENHPEFWEKIVEEYEVVASYNNKITSVKRLSDNEIFKIGDLCYPKGTVNNVHPIEDIDVLGSGKLRLGSINWYVNIEDVIKFNKIEIKTYDNQVLTIGDGGFVVYKTVLNTYKVSPVVIHKDFELSKEGAIFAVMQNAYDYVNMKDHCLSINEVSEALDDLDLNEFRFKENLTAKLLELVDKKKFKEN